MSVAHFPSPAPSAFLIPRLFALIIGINRYKVKQFSTLHGAEPDALAFRSYLENDLHVPADQIKVLLNEHATRSNIVAALEGMATNPLILTDDPIVIFYAGHGTELAEGVNPGVKIQMLVPYDFSSEPGEEIATITDRQIERLIGSIAAQKGDNITVILDCCHSASGTRDIGNNPSTTIVRSIEIEGPIDANLRQRISRDANLQEVEGKPTEPRRKGTIDHYRPAGLQSHMLIAACGASEQAKEINGHGNFSVALLKLFKTHSPDKLRYCDILTQMDAIQGQNPQCEGKNQHRILFNAKVAAPARTFRVNFGERTLQGHISITVEAGSAHGVTEGAEFSIYSESDLRFEKRLTLGTVKSVAAFTSTLNDLPYPGVNPCIAIQTKAGQKEDVRLFVPQGNSFFTVFESVRNDHNNHKYDLHNITLVADQSIAHLKATMKGADVQFEIADERVTRYGFTQQFKTVDIVDSDRVGWTFSRIAHFYRELNKANSNSKLTSLVRLEFYELEENDDDDLVAFGKNLCNSGTIDVDVNEEIPYGIKLVNESNFDLYPYLFWFDNTDLSIKDCYLSPALPNLSYKQDSPLPRQDNGVNGELTIGYGFGGGREPFCFSLKDGQHLDVSFFKLFISTKPIDFSYISQTSPFDIDRGLGQYRPRPKAERWDTILIPVVQRRAPLNENKE
ncbi:caspase domain-containing protein [Gymnopilus junonius]|uniref:Caspase domain-containing protein n=1 Tax=Gymnopilus junonius TaxID=109634 RepID=A0A9P5TFT3_GYMJU|nr:caspase domain-containing protein [Gymnopilus junonius]